MFSNLRKHFGTAGLLVAVVALIAALGGSAIAANGDDGQATASQKKRGPQGLNGKQKREVRNLARNIAKRFQGSGPQGPQGLPGAQGLQGLQGAPGVGTKGDTGADGKSVNVTEIEVGEAECEERGGAMVQREGSSEATEVCNGAEGSPWTAGGTLPTNATQTGSWAFGKTEGTNDVNIPVGFSIPLESDLGLENVHFINEAGKEVYLEVDPIAETQTLKQVDPANCDGSAAAPSADPGHLCVYAAVLTNARIPSYVEVTVLPGKNLGNMRKAGAFGQGGASTAGSVLIAEPSAINAFGSGTWAVTAP